MRRIAILIALAAAACAPPCPEPRIDILARPCPSADAGHEHHGEHGPLVHRFESAAEWAKALEAPDRDEWQRPTELVKAMAVVEGMTVADLGTGTGYFLPYLARAVGPAGRVLALDIEPDMIRWVRDRVARDGLANVEPRIVLGDDPLLGDASVDRILVVDTWHHIPERDDYVKRLVRSLKPGGSVWIVDFELESEHGPPKGHKIPPDHTADELRRGGLEVRIDTTLLPEQYIAIGTRR